MRSFVPMSTTAALVLPRGASPCFSRHISCAVRSPAWAIRWPEPVLSRPPGCASVRNGFGRGRACDAERGSPVHLPKVAVPHFRHAQRARVWLHVHRPPEQLRDAVAVEDELGLLRVARSPLSGQAPCSDGRLRVKGRTSFSIFSAYSVCCASQFRASCRGCAQLVPGVICSCSRKPALLCEKVKRYSTAMTMAQPSTTSPAASTVVWCHFLLQLT